MELKSEALKVPVSFRDSELQKIRTELTRLKVSVVVRITAKTLRVVCSRSEGLRQGELSCEGFFLAKIIKNHAGCAGVIGSSHGISFFLERFFATRDRYLTFCRNVSGFVGGGFVSTIFPMLCTDCFCHSGANLTQQGVKTSPFVGLFGRSCPDTRQDFVALGQG